MEKYEHLLQEGIERDLERYIRMVGKDPRNRYACLVNHCILKLLSNELENSSNRKMLKISAVLLKYLADNIRSFFLSL